MKKVLFTMMVALFIGTAAHAQFRVGLKGGLNFSNLSGVSDVNTNNSTGFHIGAFFGAKFSKFAIEPAILFSTQGSELEDLQTSITGKFKNDYMNIPILVKFYLVGGLHIQSGIQFGFLTRAEIEDNLTGESSDVKDDVKNSDIAIPVGVGIDLPLGLVADLRYNIGVNNIAESTLGVGGNDENIKNQVWQLSVGWRILGK